MLLFHLIVFLGEFLVILLKFAEIKFQIFNFLLEGIDVHLKLLLDRDVLAIPRYVGGCCVLIGIFQCGWRAESSYEVYDSGAMSV